MKSKRQQHFMGASGLLSNQPSKKEADEIRKKHTNNFGEFQHKNPRLHKNEHISLERIDKFNRKKFLLVGKSPGDKKTVTKIIHHE